MEDEAMEMMAGEAVGTKRNLIFVLLICFLAVSSWLVWKGDPDAVAGQKGKYVVKCEDIRGGQCKRDCSENDKRINQIQIAEGEQKGIKADTDCSSYGKDYICCVEKDKIK
jgi:hypothetical protein